MRLELNGVVSDAFPTIRSAKLLVLLSLSRSGRMSRESLADLLWPDDFYDATRLRLRQEIHRLRKALGPMEGAITTTLEEVILDRLQVPNDFDFLKSTSADDPALTEPFLQGWDEPWVAAERPLAGEAQRKSALALGHSLIESGDAEAGLNLAHKLIRCWPLDESLRILAVDCHAALGSMSAAVAEFQEFRRLLRAERGEEPSNEAQARLDRALSADSQTEEFDLWPATIPSPIDRLVGREKEVSHIVENLAPPSRSRLTTLLGPGGIGKTRILIEAMQRLMPLYKGRAAFVAFADAEPDFSWQRFILDHLKAQAPAEAEPHEILSRVLSSAPALLALDNIEELAPTIADGVRRLLESAPGLSILATSRVPLRIPGESILAVGPLDPSTDGRELLLNGLRAARPIAATLATQDQALDQLAARLDGYPLAIRLAAARFRTLSPAALLAEINRDPSFLRDGSTHQRHQSLDAALRGSYDALSRGDQEALFILAEFPGGIGLRLAEWALEGNTVDVLERLADSAMLSLDDRGSHLRFRLLTPIREFLRSQRSQAEAENARNVAVRAITRCLQEAKLLSGSPVTIQALSDLDDEHENVSAVIEWAVNHDPVRAAFLMRLSVIHDLSRARHALSLDRLDRLEAGWPNPDTSQRIALALTRAALLLGLNRDEEALPLLERAEASEALAGDSSLRTMAWMLRAAWYGRKGQKEGRDWLAEAEAFFEGSGNECGLGRVWQIRGSRAHLSGETRTGIAWLEKALKAYGGCGDRVNQAYCGVQLAALLSDSGMSQRASRILEEHRSSILVASDPTRTAWLHEVEGRAFLAQGMAVEAEASFRASLKLWTQVGSDFQCADQLLSLTRSLLDQSRLTEAEVTLCQSAQLWFDDKNYGGLCQSISSASFILQQKGHVREARAALAYSYRFHSEHGFGLTEQEEQFRDQVAEGLGGCEPCQEQTSLEGAFELFKPFFTPSLRRR